MRLLQVLLAYVCSAFAAAALFLFGGALSGDGFADWSLHDWTWGLSFFGLVASAYAAPIALPVIAWTEYRHIGSWKVFALAGALLGALLAFLFSELPFDWRNLLVTAPLIPISILAALSYWLIAWDWGARRTRTGKLIHEMLA